MIFGNYRNWQTPYYLIIVLALLQFIIALYTHSLSFTHEEAMWQYIGRNWVSNGLAPYEGGVDNKSPLIFYIFGISDKLFGNNTWFPRLLGTIVQSAGIVFLYKAVLLLAGKKAAVFSTVIYGLSLMWVITGGRYVSFTETYCVALLLAAFYYALKAEGAKYYFISGLLAGAAIGFRLTAFFGATAILILLFYKNYKKLPAFLSGGLLFSLLFVSWLLFNGINIQDYVFYSFTDNFGAGSITDLPVAIKWNNFKEAFVLSPLLLFYPFIVYYALKAKSNRIILIWLCLELIGMIVIGEFARNHLKQVLPALSIIAGIAVAFLSETYALSYKWVYAVLLLAFFPKTLEPVYGIKNSLFPIEEKSEAFCTAPFEQPDPYQLKLLGYWLNQNSKPSDNILVVGMGAQVLAYSERLSPSIYFNATGTESAKKRFLQDVISSLPDMILIPKFDKYRNAENDELSIFINELATKKYLLMACHTGYDVYIRNR